MTLSAVPGTLASATESEENLPDYSGRSGSFVRYCQAVADRPGATDTLSLNAADATLSPSLSARQEDGSARIETGGYAQWSFSVEKKRGV